MTLNSKMYQHFITGTDTDVGKSVVSFLLLKAMIKRGLAPVYLKPLQTGCESPNAPEADAFAISERLKNAEKTIQCKTLYCLPEPKAPWFAALNADKKIDTDQLLSKIDRLKKGSNALVVEGAGGLMVPITENFLMIDLLPHLKLPVILVARDSLGTINHTLLSISSLKAQGISNIKVVLTATSSTPTPYKMLAENKRAIEHFGHVPVAGHIGWIKNFEAIPDSIMATIYNILS
jgi:dethiobiotin synthetase